MENRLYWLGGIFDGEGTITVCMSRQRRSPINYSPRIGFVNTDPKIIEEGTSILTEAGIPFHVQSNVVKNNELGKKICYRLNIGGMKRCLRAAEILRPYLFSKQHKLDAMIEWIRYRFSLPHKHPQTETDVKMLEKIREKPIDPMLSMPFRDRTPSPTFNVGEDTVRAST